MLELVLKLDNKEFKHFSSVDVMLGIDTVASTYSFNGFFDIDDKLLKELFKPLSYKNAEVWAYDEENGIKEKLITGTNLNHTFSVQRKKQLTGVSGYSKTGILEDCNIPLALYPLQFDNLGLDEIAKKICKYFGIKVKVFDNAKVDASKSLGIAKSEPTQSIKEFLSDIARNRNITVSHDNLGQLLLYKIQALIPPKIKINEDDLGVTKITFNPNGQSMHSSITVIKQASTEDENEGKATVNSPFVTGIDRPKVQYIKFGANIDTRKSAEALVCVEAKNLPVTVELEGWTFQNKIVRSGFYIELTAPSIFIQTTKMILQSVQFLSDPKKGKTMTLTAVLPCVYTGKLPTKSPFV